MSLNYEIKMLNYNYSQTLMMQNGQQVKVWIHAILEQCPCKFIFKKIIHGGTEFVAMKQGIHKATGIMCELRMIRVCVLGLTHIYENVTSAIHYSSKPLSTLKKKCDDLQQQIKRVSCNERVIDGTYSQIDASM